jgi:hypothetical protein
MSISKIYLYNFPYLENVWVLLTFFLSYVRPVDLFEWSSRIDQFLDTYVWIFIYIFMRIYIFICIHVYISYIYINIYIYVYIHIYVYTCNLYIYMYIYIYIYMHISRIDQFLAMRIFVKYMSIKDEDKQVFICLLF